MILVVIIILYILVSFLSVGIFGGLCAFILSQHQKIVSTKILALTILIFALVQDYMWYAFAESLELTLTTKNSYLIELMGTSDLSDIFNPSFNLFDVVLYSIDVIIGTWFGKFIIHKYYEKKSPTSKFTEC
jgi:hypothetical protein